MPARCWMAPEMPLATYSCGETVLPVCPTWKECGYQPESTAAREAPTAAPRLSANASTSEKSPPVPRPPETTMAASVSSGRPVEAFSELETILAPLAASETSTLTASTVPAPAAASGLVEFGLTHTTGTPLVTTDFVVKLPAKTDCVVVTVPPSTATSTASVIMPDSVLSATRAAISLPSPPETTSTAAGEVSVTILASASALGATRYSS